MTESRMGAPAGACEVCASLALGILFYAVVTPIGLVLRWAGCDPLRRRFQPQQSTYWVPKMRGGRPPLAEKQFWASVR